MGFEEASLEPEEALFRALARAEDRVSRLDERAAASTFAAGWRRRADVRTVLAQAWVQGDLVHPEDLLLHALAADARTPDRAVVRANANLRSRDKAWRGGEELLSWSGVAWLTSERREAPPPGRRPSLRVSSASGALGAFTDLGRFFDRLHRRDETSARACVEECLEVLDVAGSAPPLLSAVALLEAWRVVAPLPHAPAIGGILASLLLKTSGRFKVGLFPNEVALRRRSMPARLAWAPLPDRLGFWLETVARSADLELEELDRLKLQKALLDRRISGGRSNSKLAALAALALDNAVLTTELVARELVVTPQGAGLLLGRLDGVLKEITGRTRYRVWRL